MQEKHKRFALSKVITTNNVGKLERIWIKTSSAYEITSILEFEFNFFILQARCLTPVTSSTEKSMFLAGTVGAKENAVYLLEYNDEDTNITPTSYHHPDEIWDIVSCPNDEHLFFTCHSPGTLFML